MLINLVYVAAAVLFILGLKLLGSPATARRGNVVSASGMLIAVVATLLDQNIAYLALEQCFASVAKWMFANRLKLNMEKNRIHNIWHLRIRHIVFRPDQCV